MSKPEVENKKISDVHLNIDNLDLEKFAITDDSHTIKIPKIKTVTYPVEYVNYLVDYLNQISEKSRAVYLKDDISDETLLKLTEIGELASKSIDILRGVGIVNN